MGLAASQARGILLTARLNDVEFEAQQINQARARLSDQSANYYNQLLDMEVPCAPSKSDFTSLHYTYNANGKDYTISNIGYVNNDGTTTVTTQTKGYGATVKEGEGTIHVGSTTTKKSSGEIILTSNKDDLYGTFTPVKVAEAYDPAGSYVDRNGNNIDMTAQVSKLLSTGNFLDANGVPLTTYQTPMFNNSGVEQYAKEAWTEEVDNGDGTYTYVQHPAESYNPKRYQNTGEVSANDFYNRLGIVAYQKVADGDATHYIGDKAIEETNYQLNGQAAIELSDLPKESAEYSRLYTAIVQTGKEPDDYYVVANGSGSYNLVLKADVMDGDDSAKMHTVQDTNDALLSEEQNVSLDFDTNTGRASAITLPDGTRIALTPVTITDEDGYNDAMNEYNYQKAQYDQEQAEINAQMSIIQVQDKKLELKLKKLDTERSELTTELDAVKTVLGDASERGFKTFSG